METHSERLSPHQPKRSSSSAIPNLNTGNSYNNTDIICCSCGDDDDSGFTIQCGECLTWQHGGCLNISPSRVPQHHTCYSCRTSPRRHYLRQGDGKSQCSPSKQQQQQHWRQKQQLFTPDGSGNNTPKALDNQLILGDRKDKKIARTSFTNTPKTITNNKRNKGSKYGNTGSVRDDGHIPSIDSGCDLAKGSLVKHESAPDASQFINLNAPTLTTSNKKQQVKRKGFAEGFNHRDILKKRTKIRPAYGSNSLGNDTKDYDDDDKDSDDNSETVTPYDYSSTANTTKISLTKPQCNSAETRSPKSSGGFVQVYRNIIKNKLVKQIMKEAREQWKSGDSGETSPAVSLDPSVLLPSIPKISVRPLWKSLLGDNTISSRGKADDPSVRNGVFAEIHVPENRFLLEINGEISIKSAYKCKLGSLYPLLHTPEQHLFFYPSMDLLIDARSYGNDSRYIRRSCHPNAQIKCITLASHGKNDDIDNDQTVHLGLFTLEDVEKGEEISVAWDWQRGTTLWQKYTQWKRQQQQPSPPSAADTIATHEDIQVKHMLDNFEKEFGGCACEDKNDCFLSYLKGVCSLPASTDHSSNSNKRGFHRRRQHQSGIPGSNDVQSKIVGQRRRSKDSSSQQSTRSKPSVAPHQKQTVSLGSSTPIRSNKCHRSSKSSTSLDLAAINTDAKNDLFFASLPTSRATSPIHNVKLTHSSTIASVPAPASSASVSRSTSTIMMDITQGTDSLIKKWTASSKLPCKKAWMKTYLAQLDRIQVIHPVLSSTVKSNFIDAFWDDSKDDSKPPYLETRQQPESTNEIIGNDDLVMEGSIVDNSSTAALHLDDNQRGSSDSGVDKLTNDSVNVNSVLSLKSDRHTTFLATAIQPPLIATTSDYSMIKEASSYVDDHCTHARETSPPAPFSPSPKPVKAKLSLREYLSMRKKA